MATPKVGFFDFTSCEGCQIELTNYGDEAFLEFIKHVDIVEFREAMTETSEYLDIACIEGSFSRGEDRARLLDIRNRSKVVIAFGACAATGGINALKNHQNDYKTYVYGDDADMPHLNSALVKPISSVIKVDYFVPGCPVDKYEFLRIVTHILHDKEPVIPSYPVCMECKRNGNICRFEEDDHCLGIVARAGCDAPCPGLGVPCEACRGFVDNANEAALKKVLKERAGFSESRAENKSRMFTANMRSDAI